MKCIKALLPIVFFGSVHLQGSGQSTAMTSPANIVAQAESGKEGAVVNDPTPPEGLGNVTFTPASGSFFRLGSHSIIAVNAAGQKCSFTVTVTDNESPSLSPLTLSRAVLWPDNNKMKKVNVYYEASDNGATVKSTISVSSNATDGIRDFEIVDSHLVKLKTSRLPDGTARVYTITVTAVDDSGNKTTRSTTIAVSKTMTAVATTN